MSILCEALIAKVTNYLILIFHPDASKPMFDRFRSNFQGSSKIYSMVHTRSLKLLCLKEVEPFISVRCYSGFFYNPDVCKSQWLTINQDADN